MDEMTSGMDEYTPDIYTLEDEDGNELEFELVDILNFEGEKYFGLTPFDPEGGDGSPRLVENGGDPVEIPRLRFPNIQKHPPLSFCIVA